MSKLRLVFVKEHQASYISHLDVMRTFQRVFPRAGLSIKHSNGFHPHPILSIVLPLPVGQSSDCEILDFESVEDSTGEGVAEALNTGMPAGLRVLDCYCVTRPVREMVNLRAQLEMEYDNGVPEGACERIREFFTQEEIFVEKRTKHKGMTELNIAPLIRKLDRHDNENQKDRCDKRHSQRGKLLAHRLIQAIGRHLNAVREFPVLHEALDIFFSRLLIICLCLHFGDIQELLEGVDGAF